MQKKEEEVRILKADLKNLAQWDIDWQMLFDVRKYLVMHIDANNNLYTYNMNNAILKTADMERDLGVIINKNGKYSEQCLMAAKKQALLKKILNVRTLILSRGFINP